MLSRRAAFGLRFKPRSRNAAIALGIDAGAAVLKDADDVPRLRKRRTSHTRTGAADFLDLNKLKAASAEQQRELAAVKAELTAAYRASAEELQSQVTGTAAERDARWARKLRTVEQMHATALEHARLAGEQGQAERAREAAREAGGGAP